MKKKISQRIFYWVSVIALLNSSELYLAKAGDIYKKQPISGAETTITGFQALLPPAAKLPDWMSNKDRNEIYRKRGIYNNDIYNIPLLALDLNAIAVGHAFAYEDLVTGKEKDLETDTFRRINWVLKNPPRFMPDEGRISPTFGRKYGVLEQIFDWTHILHAQTVDVLASTEMTAEEKETEIERLYKFYTDSVPYAITGLPMNMGYLDGQPYSKTFRRQYPKVNGLFWGYHWLQGAMYDLLYTNQTLAEQRAAYAQLGRRYREVELYRLDRSFMPMFAELSPHFAERFPQIANTFDNLHMLHDLVNDILAADWISPQQKQAQIERAIWMVMAANHRGEKSGDNNGGEGLHDHRFVPGTPGMGLMPEASEHDHGNQKITPSQEHHDHEQVPEGAEHDHSNHETTPSQEHHDHEQTPEGLPPQPKVPHRENHNQR